MTENCARCGKRVENPKYKRCNKCRADQRRWNLEYRCRKIDAKVCLRCGSDLDDLKYATCLKCREYQNGVMKSRVSLLSKEGACIKCGGFLDDPTYRQCSSCRTKGRLQHHLKYTNRKKLHRCGICGEPVEDKSYRICASCRSRNHKMNNLYLKRRAKEMEAKGKAACTRCGSEKQVDGFKTCIRCRKYQANIRKTEPPRPKPISRKKINSEFAAAVAKSREQQNKRKTVGVHIYQEFHKKLHRKAEELDMTNKALFEMLIDKYLSKVVVW